MKIHNNISDEELGAYLDRLMKDKNEGLHPMMMCSMMPQADSDDCDSYFLDEKACNNLCDSDFDPDVDDMDTMEVLDVSAKAMEYFADDDKNARERHTYRRRSSNSSRIMLKRSFPKSLDGFCNRMKCSYDSDDDDDK